MCDQKKKNIEFKLFAKIKFVILEGDVKQVIDKVKWVVVELHWEIQPNIDGIKETLDFFFFFFLFIYLGNGWDFCLVKEIAKKIKRKKIKLYTTLLDGLSFVTL